MKNRALLFCVFLLVLMRVDAQSHRTVLMGKITNPENDKIQLVNFNPYENLTLPATTLDKNNGFKLVFELSEPKYLRIEHGTQVADFLVMPKDSVFLTFDMVNMDSTLQASGTHAPHYFYWRENAIFSQRGRSNIALPARMAEIIDSSFAVKRKFFADFVAVNKAEIAPEFIRHYEAAYTYRPLSKIYFYPFTYAQQNNLEVEDVPLPENYYAEFEKAKINVEENWNVLEYRNFLEEYIYHNYKQLVKRVGKPIDGNDACLERYELGKMLLDGKGKWELLAYILDSDLHFDGSPSAFRAYERFMEDCPDDFIKNKLKQAYEEVKISVTGNVMPNFTALNAKREKVSLSDFKGKVVLLDVWAPNCGYCWYEFRHENTKKLKQHFAQNSDIVFLYVCVSRSESDWKKLMTQSPFPEMGGVQLYDSDFEKGNIMETIGAKGFPSYYVLDKTGKILSSNPPRPSNPALIPILEAALK